MLLFFDYLFIVDMYLRLLVYEHICIDGIVFTYIYIYILVYFLFLFSCKLLCELFCVAESKKKKKECCYLFLDNSLLQVVG